MLMNTAASRIHSQQRHSCTPDTRPAAGGHVIIINLTRFGDLLQSQALIHDLHHAGLRVGLVCLENFVSALPLLQHVDMAWPLPGARIMTDVTGGWRRAALRLLAFVHEIRQHMPGARVINLTATLPARLLARLVASRPGDITGFGMDAEGFGYSGGVWASFLAGTVLRRLNTPFNLVDTFRMVGASAMTSAEKALLAARGGLPGGRSGLQTPAEAEREFARTLLQEGARAAGIAGNCKGFVALQLGASEARRQWPAASFAALGDRLWREKGLCPVLLGSRAEQPLAEEYMRAAHGPCITAVGRTDIAQLAGLLTHCRLLVTNDTGTMHLAAGLGVPCLAIFLATAQPWDTGPYLPGCCCLEPAMPCHPCPYGGACPHDHACLGRMSPEGVGDLVCGWLASGRWGVSLEDGASCIGREARVWQTETDDCGFAALRCLSGHGSQDRSQWLDMQRFLWRHIFDKLGEGVPEGTQDRGMYAPATLSPAFAATVNDALAQSLQLLALLEEQAGLVGRSAMAGQLFLRNCERLQSLLDASPALTALGGFWRELRQQRGGHMAELTQLIQCLRTALEHFRVEMIWRLREQAPAVKA